MKKINSLALLMAAFCLSVSCSESFLDTEPTSSVAESTIFSNTETALMAVDGIARIMHDCSTSWVSQGSYPTFCLHLAMMSDDVIYTYTHTQFKDSQNWVRHRDLTHKYYDINYYWKVFYRVISNANKIISYIDRIPGDELTRQWIKGQAYSYRAFCHFQLVQTWAQRYDASGNNTQLGIVIRTDNEGTPKARSSVEEVYAQILSDINEGISCLEQAAAFKKHDKSNIDQWVAKGIKARVLLNMGKWAEAAAVAQDVVDNSGACLAVSTYADTDKQNRFGEASNDEWMWACISSRTDYSQFGGNRRCWHDHISNNPTTDNNTSPKAINRLLYNTIPDTDVRKAMWSADPYSNPNLYIAAAGKKAMYMSQKWLVDDIVMKYAERDVPYMRFPEMMLIAAEGYARSNQPAKAQQLVYDLGHFRDPSYSKPTESGDALCEKILWQRRVELWAEAGLRWLDLKRLNLPCDRGPAPRAGYNQGPWKNSDKVAPSNIDPQSSNYDMYGSELGEGARYIPAGDKRWQWLIPTQEINANPLCEPNEL